MQPPFSSNVSSHLPPLLKAPPQTVLQVLLVPEVVAGAAAVVVEVVLGAAYGVLSHQKMRHRLQIPSWVDLPKGVLGYTCPCLCLRTSVRQ